MPQVYTVRGKSVLTVARLARPRVMPETRSTRHISSATGSVPETRSECVLVPWLTPQTSRRSSAPSRDARVADNHSYCVRRQPSANSAHAQHRGRGAHGHQLRTAPWVPPGLLGAGNGRDDHLPVGPQGLRGGRAGGESPVPRGGGRLRFSRPRPWRPGSPCSWGPRSSA